MFFFSIMSLVKWEFFAKSNSHKIRYLMRSDDLFYHSLRIEKSKVEWFGILSQNLRWIKLNQSATFHDHNFIIIGNCIQPMCDGQQCGWFEFFAENSLNRFIGFTVYTCSRFRKDLKYFIKLTLSFICTEGLLDLLWNTNLRNNSNEKYRRMLLTVTQTNGNKDQTNLQVTF